jgi:hypothetical protein
VLKPGASVTVHVVQQTDRGMSPIAEFTVRLEPIQALSAFYRPFTGTSSSEGVVTLSGVSPGAYRVLLPPIGETGERDSARPSTVAPSEPGACVREMRQAATPLAGNQVLIGDNPAPVTVILEASTTRIFGGLGLDGADAIVVLLPDSPTPLQRSLAVIADQNGDFGFRCVVPGEYRLYAFTNLPGAAYRNDDFMRNFRDRGVPVRAVEGGALNVQVDLIEP